MRRATQSSSKPVRTAALVYEATLMFCGRFLDRHSPVAEKLIHAARLACQNIAEASKSSAPAGQIEFQIADPSIANARASLDELRMLFLGLLHERRLRHWTAADPEAQALRGIAGRPGAAIRDFEIWLGCTAPSVVMNAILCLIDETADSLRQPAGASEHSSAMHPIPVSTPTGGPFPGAPSCPKCGQPMALRTARKGARAGGQFWGCSAYPKCTGTRPGQ